MAAAEDEGAALSPLNTLLDINDSLDKLDEGGGGGGGGGGSDVGTNVTTNTTVNPTFGITVPPPSSPSMGRQTSTDRLLLMERFLQQFELSAKKSEELYFKLTDEDDGYGMTDPQQFKTMDLSTDELEELKGMFPRAKQAQWVEIVIQIIGTAPAPLPPAPPAPPPPQSPVAVADEKARSLNTQYRAVPLRS